MQHCKAIIFQLENECMDAIKAPFKGGSVCRVSSWSQPNTVSDGGGKKGQADLRLPIPGSGVQYSSSQLHLSRPLFNLPLGSTPIYYHETQRKKTWLERLWTPRSVQFSSVAQSCPTLCDPMNCSTPDLPVHHQLLEFTQTHVHWVSDAIQPSHPLSSPSPPALSLSQHQGLLHECSTNAPLALKKMRYGNTV